MKEKNRYIERRKYKRKDIYCLLRYKTRREGGESHSVLTSLRNIGGGGLLFKSKEYLPLETPIDMTISIPPMDKTISVSAKVVRFESNERSGTYLIGVMFTDIKEEDKNAIIRLAE